MSAEIVQLREGPPLTDVVAHIRAFADRIEAGDHGDVDAVFALIVQDGDYPTVFGWGDVSGKNDPAIQFDLAKLWLLMNLTKRET